MRRRDFISVIAAATAWPLAALARQSGMPVVGFLNVATAEGISGSDCRVPPGSG